MHDNIISSLFGAYNSDIPKSRLPVSKVVAGWNEYVEEYFQASHFWHDMWKANDQPREGLIADLRRKTRREYHKVCKLFIQREGEGRSDKMAQSILNNCTGTFWKEAKKIPPKKVFYPNKVDEAIGVQNITNAFGGTFDKLYNSVSYNVDDMNILKNDIISAVSNKCKCSNCIHGNHSITFKYCHDAIKKLKQSKSDGCSGILSDHIIHSSDKLTCSLTLLFTAILHLGTSPDGILLGTMDPLPRGRWANLSSSDNFRAIITLRFIETYKYFVNTRG